MTREDERRGDAERRADTDVFSDASFCRWHSADFHA